MAQEESMFGPTPLAIQDQLDQQFLQRNSNLDLGSMSARAGLAMGSGINGLLGREDPRVAEAKQVQEAVAELRKSGVDMSNPEEYYKKMAGIFGAKGLTAQAEKAAMKALEYQDKQAERAFKTEDRQAQLQIRSQDLAIKNAQLAKEMEKAKEKPGFEQLLKTLKDGYSAANVDQESLTKVFKVFAETGSISLALDEVKNKKEKSPEQWGEPVERNVNGKVVLQQQNLGTKEWKTLAGNEANIRNTTNVNAGLRDFTGEHNIISKGLDDVKKYRDQLSAIRSAMSVNDKSDPTAQNAADVLIAKAIQPGGTLSNQDINRTLGAGDFATRVADKINRFVDGKPTKFTQAERAALLKVMEKAIVKDYNSVQSLPRKAAGRAGYNPDEFFQNETETPDAPAGKPAGIKDSTWDEIQRLKRKP